MEGGGVGSKEYVRDWRGPTFPESAEASPCCSTLGLLLSSIHGWRCRAVTSGGERSANPLLRSMATASMDGWVRDTERGRWERAAAICSRDPPTIARRLPLAGCSSLANIPLPTIRASLPRSVDFRQEPE